ncbi:unnamed protein product [Ilex paraguariensis]
MAAIGEKEWFFYVPRDRKYRNGDRPNRVTTSGYWKATGADRMIRTENSQSIGLKKTLVFYTGKAPKGIRTSWIMNEYRLPQHETEQLQKAEISLCRVYKRPGVEDHPSLPRSLPTRASSSRGAQSDHKKKYDATNHVIERFQALTGSQAKQIDEKMSETSGSSSTDVGTALGLSNHNSYIELAPNLMNTTVETPASTDEDTMSLLDQSRQTTVPKGYFSTSIFMGSSSMQSNGVDDLHRLVSYQQDSINHQEQYHHVHPSQFSNLLAPPQSLALNMMPAAHQATYSDQYYQWDWSSISETSKDYGSPFK